MDSFVEAAIIWLGPNRCMTCEEEYEHFVLHKVSQSLCVPPRRMAIKEEDHRFVVVFERCDKMFTVIKKISCVIEPDLLVRTNTSGKSIPFRNFGLTFDSVGCSPLRCLSRSSMFFSSVCVASQ